MVIERHVCHTCIARVYMKRGEGGAEKKRVLNRWIAVSGLGESELLEGE